MWYFLIKAIASGIIGNAVNNWFADTKIGVWFYKRIDDVASWASRKLGLKVLQDEKNFLKASHYALGVSFPQNQELECHLCLHIIELF